MEENKKFNFLRYKNNFYRILYKTKFRNIKASFMKR